MRQLHLVVALLFLPSAPLLAQDDSTPADDFEPTCDSVAARITVEGITLSLCRMSYPGGDITPPFEVLFAMEAQAGNERLVKKVFDGGFQNSPKGTDPFHFWRTEPERVGNGFVWSMYLWFTAGATTYILNQCGGGMACMETVTLTVISNGQRLRQGECDDTAPGQVCPDLAELGNLTRLPRETPVVEPIMTEREVPAVLLRLIAPE